MLPTIIEAAFRTFVLGAVIWAGLRVLRVESVRTRKAVWMATLLAAVLMPVIMQWHTVRVTPPVSEHAVTKVVRAIPLHSTVVSRPSLPVSSQKAPLPMFDWKATLIRVALACYLVVAALLGLRLFIGVALVLQLWLKAKTAPQSWASGVRVRIASSIKMPVTIGSGILLPDEAKAWDAARLRTVIAHEQSHVMQGDFYIQLLAGLHAAVFWFSPLSWWMRRELSYLGEAISDEAGLREAEDRSLYAELLLEVARNSDRYVAGVAMAHSGNIGRRIERILGEARSGMAFTWKRGLALGAIFLPVAALTAGLTLSTNGTERAMAPGPAEPAQRIASPGAPLPPDATASTPALAPVPDVAPPPSPEPLPALPAPPAVQSSWSWFTNDSTESFALVTGGAVTIMNGESGDAERAKRYQAKVHGDYIWFTRNGKPYIITDPALVQQGKSFFREQEELGRKQALLGEQQARLGEEQARLAGLQGEVAISAPELEKKLAALAAQIDAARARLKSDKNERVQQHDLIALQERMAAIESDLGAAQGRLSEKEGELGEKQGKLGEEQGKLGEEQEKLGELQSKLAEDATKNLQKLMDQAVRDGKAKRAD